MDSGPQSEFGWAQQDVTNLNARGLGLGETPLRRWEAVPRWVGRKGHRSQKRAVTTPN
jgi:hypothetical protein